MKASIILALCMSFATSGLAETTASTLDQDTIEQATRKLKPTPKHKTENALTIECNAKASRNKADDRKKFLVACLKGKGFGVSVKQQAQMRNLNTCTKKAARKSMQGDARKKFMNACLKR